MRKIALFLICAMILTHMTGCAKKLNPTQSGTVAVGGWTLAEPSAIAMEESQKQAFHLAFEGITNKPQPIACLASQIVAGQNFCYLVKIGADDTEYTPGAFALCYVYAAPDHTAQLTDMREIDLSAQDQGSYDAGSVSPFGGWILHQIEPDDDDASLFFQAYGSDCSVTPVALLATQVVTGINRLYLAQVNTDTSHKYQLITLYQDVQNQISVTDQSDFSFLP